MTTKLERIQFRPGQLAPQIQSRTDNDESGLSADLVARRDLHRYYTALANDLRAITLTKGEALLCCEALGAPLGDPDDTTKSAGSIFASIIDAMALDRLDEKFDVDRDTFSAKVAAWTAGQRYAVADAVERWWLLPDSEQDDIATLTKVGLLRSPRLASEG